MTKNKKLAMLDDKSYVALDNDRNTTNKIKMSPILGILFCLSLLTVLSIGCVIGYWYATVTSSSRDELTTSTTQSPSTKTDYLGDVEADVVEEIKAENIRENLKILTSKPHLAGSVQDEDYLVSFVRQRWEGYLDDVEVFPYDVLLSFPNETDKNYVAIVDENGTITRKSNPVEEPVTAFERKFQVVSAFNSYAPAGTVTGNMYYVNYGREEDFRLLSQFGINLNGSICIARYGRVFRGDKARFAALYNCSALVIYSDPLEYANASLHSWNPNTKNDVYPNSLWLPSTGFQRGSILIRDGDPLTPNYPSLNFTHRVSTNETDLPKIPVLPIGYKDAYQYLSILSGPDAPNEWQGGFNVTYKFGGSFQGSHADYKAVVHVANHLKRKTIHTVIGFIRGWLEPDRYVIMGNHRDAWTFGATDPNCGTAIMLEMSRAIAKVMSKGEWRPRRTLVFCSWAAEEFGIIGSTEWVEQMEKRLMMQAVSYLNIDVAVNGNATFYSSSTPSLKQLLFNVTKSVDNPSSLEITQGRKTVYDTWLFRNKDPEDPNLPLIENVGAGTDYTAFLQQSGVDCFAIGYDGFQRSYPTYHSLHDTFEYYENFIDNGFNISVTIASVAAKSLLRLSGSRVLPFNPIDTAQKLLSMAENLQKTYNDIFNDKNVSLDELYRTINVFKSSSEVLMHHVSQLNASTNEIQLRLINDKLFHISRGFLDFQGLTNQRYYRNVVFAPSSYNNYYGAGFPALNDAALEAQRSGLLERVKQDLSIVCLKILSAAQMMKNF